MIQDPAVAQTARTSCDRWEVREDQVEVGISGTSGGGEESLTEGWEPFSAHQISSTKYDVLMRRCAD